MQFPQKEVTLIAESFFKEILTFIQENYEQDFTCFCKLDFGEKRKNSWGGKYAKGYGVSIAVLKHLPKKFPTQFREYSSFNKDKVIGGFNYNEKTPYLELYAIICHEVAHAVDFYKRDKTNHDENWKYWYRILRQAFINFQIDSTIKIEEKPNQGFKIEKQVEIDFCDNCHKHGFKKEDLNTFFKFDEKDTFEIVGYNKRARKNFFYIRKVRTNKIFVGDPKVIRVAYHGNF